MLPAFSLMWIPCYWERRDKPLTWVTIGWKTDSGVKKMRMFKQWTGEWHIYQADYS